MVVIPRPSFGWQAQIMLFRERLQDIHMVGTGAVYSYLQGFERFTLYVRHDSLPLLCNPFPLWFYQWKREIAYWWGFLIFRLKCQKWMSIVTVPRLSNAQVSMYKCISQSIVYSSSSRQAEAPIVSPFKSNRERSFFAQIVTLYEVPLKRYSNFGP